jgi:DNA-binding MarR family transcriptional regulator
MQDSRLDGLAAVARPELRIIDVLERNGPLSGDQIRRIARMDTTATGKALARLRHDGVLIAVKRPGKRGVLYRLASVRRA